MHTPDDCQSVSSGGPVKLAAVSTTLPDPPYPPSTKANGFKIEFDIQRIKQSRTWKLATDEHRNVLLRLWFEAWESIPCGSLEDDDEIIAATIGVPLDWFAVHRAKILVGWKRHSDGRLYHPYITEKVLEMVSRRTSASERQRRWREKQSQQVTPMSRVISRDVREGTGTGTGTGTGLSKERIESVSDDTDSPQTDGLSDQMRSCPHKKIIDLYHKVCPQLPKVRSWEGERPKRLRARWAKHPDLEWWEGFFNYVAESPFLTGQTSSPFLADLEWMTRPENFQKIVEGKYHRSKQ